MWIDFADQGGAEVLARHYIAQAGWLPSELEETRCPVIEDYDEGEDSLQYFNEAIKFGSCLSFHLYPEGDDE